MTITQLLGWAKRKLPRPRSKGRRGQVHPDITHGKAFGAAQSTAVCTSDDQAVVRELMSTARISTIKLQKLLDGGAVVNATDQAGNTALHTAAQAGFTEAVQLLLDRGALVAAVNNDGHTAYDLALAHHAPAPLLQLLSHQLAALGRASSAVPHDVLVMLLAYLSHAGRTQQAAYVSKAWLQAAMDASHWRGLVDDQVIAVAISSGRAQLRVGQLEWALYRSNLLRNPSFLRECNTFGTSQPAWAVLQHSAELQQCSAAAGMRWESTELPQQPAAAAAEEEYCSQGRLLAPKLPLPYAYAGGNGSEGSYRGINSCCGAVAATNRITEIVQVVDLAGELVAKGVPQEAAQNLLDAGLALGLSVWVGARPCSSRFEVGLLLDDGQAEMSSWCGLCEAAGARLQLSGELQAVQGEWRQLKHVVPVVPVGTRRAAVVLRSVEGTFWEGHYGTKFASAELCFVKRADVPAFGAKQSQAFWRRRRYGQEEEEEEEEQQQQQQQEEEEEDGM